MGNRPVTRVSHAQLVTAPATVTPSKWQPIVLDEQKTRAVLKLLESGDTVPIGCVDFKLELQKPDENTPDTPRPQMVVLKHNEECLLTHNAIWVKLVLGDKELTLSCAPDGCRTKFDFARFATTRTITVQEKTLAAKV